MQKIDLLDECIKTYVPRFLTDFEVLLTSQTNRPDLAVQDHKKLDGFRLLGESNMNWPDALLWNRKSGWYWALIVVEESSPPDIEAVKALQAQVQESGGAGVGFTLVYATLHDAATNHDLAVDELG